MSSLFWILAIMVLLYFFARPIIAVLLIVLFAFWAILIACFVGILTIIAAAAEAIKGN